jgi:hypothetical protein
MYGDWAWIPTEATLRVGLGDGISSGDELVCY